MDKDEAIEMALSSILAALERLDERISALEATEHGDETAGGIPDWARQDYFCGER